MSFVTGMHIGGFTVMMESLMFAPWVGGNRREGTIYFNSVAYECSCFMVGFWIL